MKGHRIGYVRVSSFDQNPERQVGVQALRRDCPASSGPHS